MTSMSMMNTVTPTFTQRPKPEMATKSKVSAGKYLNISIYDSYFLGQYKVQLPDCRTQIVDYYVDEYKQFHADVKYEGQICDDYSVKAHKKPAPYQPAPYKSAPAPYKPAPAPYQPAPYKPAPAPYRPAPYNA
uniref:Uncharacterized protein n=1 Tax=Lepeophtheirus salmonis TaxID=72036 RepID=A0A0K2US22_LEPSM